MKILNKILPLIVWLTLCLTVEAEAQRSGVEVWAQTCGNCHFIQPAARYTAAKWNSIITNMKIHARLTDEESKAVLQYLKEGAKDMISVVPAPGEATSDEAITAGQKASSPTVKKRLTKEQVKEIDAFIQKLEKEGKE